MNLATLPLMVTSPSLKKDLYSLAADHQSFARQGVFTLSSLLDFESGSAPAADTVATTQMPLLPGKSNMYLVNDMMAEQPHNYTNASLEANRVCRVLFAIIGTIFCWVPFRLLSRNGEFAASVLIVDVVVMNLFTIFNSIIWHNDDWDIWWDGTGLCDIQVYLSAPMQTIYAACIFVVIRNLAQRVRLMRVNNLTRREKNRRDFIQALIIFPIPIIELAFTWFVLAQRYIIGTLVGCSATLDDSWPKILVYILPPALFAIGTVPYAFLMWKRFRAISKTTKAALISSSAANSRAQRTRRRLYQMSLSILVPYVPLQMVFLAFNLATTEYHPYNYHDIHYGPGDYPWNSIMLLPSWMVPFDIMNQAWIAILTTIPIVMFFGMTQEAIDMYRRYAVALGLGKCFPGLKEPWIPDRRGHTSTNDSKKSWFSSLKGRKSGDHEDEQPQNSISLTTTGLPNVHHQAIVSSSGPFIPPRHSSTSPGGPLIPPRHSSLRHDVLFRSVSQRHIPLATKIPSLSSFVGSKKKSGRDASSSNVSNGSDDSSQMLPLQDIEAGDTPRTFGMSPSLHVSSSDGQEAMPREVAGGSSRSGNIGDSEEWKPSGKHWARTTIRQED
ncbi:pheromone A receptor-domain-containing protein [Xylariales sp. AK1849]|nr:pheromone A receptor-domain-containing protein [Xylariales sp. AK1849]